MPDQEWSQESVEKQAAEHQEPAVEQEAPAPEVETEAKEKVVETVEKVVPLHALHESRAKEREQRMANQRLQQQVAELQRAQHELMQRLTQPPPPQIPTYDQDPLGNLSGTVQQTQKQLQEIADANRRREEQSVQQAQWTQFVGAVQQANKAFESQEPNANDGINFWKQSLLKEYEASGMPRQVAAQRVMREEFELAHQALSMGENPAEVAYNRAVARGYVPSQKKLEMQEKGQKAALPNASSGKSGGLPSLEALLKMDRADFSKQTAGGNWEKLMKKYS